MDYYTKPKREATISPNVDYSIASQYTYLWGRISRPSQWSHSNDNQFSLWASTYTTLLMFYSILLMFFSKPVMTLKQLKNVNDSVIWYSTFSSVQLIVCYVDLAAIH